MKLLLLGDCHIRHNKPAGRKDDFMQAQYSKFIQVMRIAKDENVTAILQAGDLFDNSRPAYSIVSLYTTAIRDANVPFYAVLGQHDCSYHQVDTPEMTVMGVLAAAGTIKILSNIPAAIGNVGIFGASFGREPISLTSKFSFGFTVLVAHASVGKPLFKGHAVQNPSAYLGTHKHDLIFVGDYHYPFQELNNNRWLINAGCLMRIRNNNLDRQLRPSVCVFDTDTRTVQRHELKFEEDVFFDDTTKEESELQTSVELLKIVDKLKESEDINMNFREVIKTVIASRKTSASALAEIFSVLEFVGVK